MYQSPWETKGQGMQGDSTELLADKEEAISGRLIKMFGRLVYCYATEVTNRALASLIFLYLYRQLIRELLLASMPTCCSKN